MAGSQYSDKVSMRVRPVRNMTSSASREKRVDVDGIMCVWIRPADGVDETFGWVKMINSKGMMVWCDTPFPAETECRFRLMIGDDRAGMYGSCWAVYTGEQGTAFQFDELPPVTLAAITNMAGPFPRQGFQSVRMPGG